MPTTTEACVQVFSVFAGMESDATSTLAALRDAGYSLVEPYGFASSAAAWRADLDEAGLLAPSGHTAVLGEDLDLVLDAAELLGIETVIDPHVDDARWDTRASIATVADELSHAAAVAADRGIRIGYHNHDTELRRRIDGVTALELLADAVDERVVLQIDAYWARIAGVDPVALVARLGERVASLHLKDGPGVGGPGEQVALGRGAQPLEALLAAAPEALRIVELDDVAGDVLADLRASREWLEARR